MMGGMQTVDEFATLSAIWILASNDERSLVTYRGIRHRLNLPDDFDLELLIRQHGELFRLGMPESQLTPWKASLLQGVGLPSWIRELDPADRPLAIHALRSDDGFRSQFRSALNSPRSEVAIIEWGLGHIERLRKARHEARAASAKSWQMWMVFATTIAGLIVSVYSALHPKP